MPWQRSVLNAWLARKIAGDTSTKPAQEGFREDTPIKTLPLHATCGLSVPRQNGKNAILEARELYGLVCAGDHILHTAHRVKTAKRSFQRLVRYFTDKHYPDLAAKVKNIRYTNGEEAIELTSGAKIEFSARSGAGNRGFDNISLIVFDEAQYLTDEQLDAVMYTLAASETGERQMIYTGTPPDAVAPGTVFTRTREAALKDTAGRICWHEWSIETLPNKESGFDDLIDAVYETNPSMGYLLEEEHTRDEFSNGSLDGFARERLGWWSSVACANRAIPKELWDKARIQEIGSRYRKKTAFGVKFSVDGTRYALAGCKQNARGECAVELIELGITQNGTRPLAQALYERRNKASAVAIDGLDGASALCENLTKLKAPRGYVVTPSPGCVVSAATCFFDALKAGTVKHTSQPALDDSACGCVRRTVGSRGGWGFGSEGEHDSLAIEAASLAVWCAKTSKRNPKRKQRML